MLATKAEAEILLPDLSEQDTGLACADAEADALAPARGIALGALLGLLCIGALVLAVWRAF
ncbi:MAG: hypothetical protein M0Z28_03985 [Rhodospirillales bacterium]|nr:hypothetical protein [Rhodospirillales bacterium]